MPVGSSDQDNAKLALQVAGSLAVTTLLQIRAEQLDLAVLPLDGVAASAKTLANKTYPLPIRVCIVVSNDAPPAAARFVAHFRSAAGQAIVESLDAAPAD
jgi:phosphate transport system substrate-binding protein